MLSTKTAKGRALVERAKNDYGDALSNIYGRYSIGKMKAMEYCRRKYCEDDCARGFRIISYNTYGFSVAWETICEIDNNIVPCVHIETPSNTYDVALI